ISYSDDDENLALCDFIGLEREVNIQLLKGEVSVGDYVIVHVGYAIQKMDIEDALETIKTFKDFEDFQKELETGFDIV
ncbi:MAG: hypothetical protein HeimC3_37970, partial [Candidatus Heimdallarchaeota archaeon LC_3]